jgi:hypothetical protein
MKPDYSFRLIQSLIQGIWASGNKSTLATYIFENVVHFLTHYDSSGNLDRSKTFKDSIPPLICILSMEL